ncbi:MAG: hypothetical protein E6J34_16425 [Chloroflexi bacterium]|nr:MAG: hypothetical protein E6J34_16425 [Chloroflexota bacterium]
MQCAVTRAYRLFTAQALPSQLSHATANKLLSITGSPPDTTLSPPIHLLTQLAQICHSRLDESLPQ